MHYCFTTRRQSIDCFAVDLIEIANFSLFVPRIGRRRFRECPFFEMSTFDAHCMSSPLLPSFRHISTIGHTCFWRSLYCTPLFGALCIVSWLHFMSKRYGLNIRIEKMLRQLIWTHRKMEKKQMLPLLSSTKLLWMTFKTEIGKKNAAQIHTDRVMNAIKKGNFRMNIYTTKLDRTFKLTRRTWYDYNS